MKKNIVAALFIVGLTSHAQSKHETGKHVILPNPKLLRCLSSDCAQRWQDKPPEANDVYPKQVIVDFYNNPCPLGVMARYDKSVSTADLKAAIDKRYGQWAFASNDTSPVKLWRVQPEKFAIQLGDTDRRIAKLAKLSGEEEDVGTKTIIYLAFRPPKNCSFP
jgi:hypothetical protein